MEIPRIVKHPAFLAVLGVSAVGLLTVLSMLAPAIPDRCKKVNPNFVIAGYSLLTMGEKNVVCVYDIKLKKWNELVFVEQPPQNTPAQ